MSLVADDDSRCRSCSLCTAVQNPEFRQFGELYLIPLVAGLTGEDEIPDAIHDGFETARLQCVWEEVIYVAQLR